MHGTIWSVVPFLAVIPLSIWTRQVLPGLLVGLFIGAYMMNPTLLGGVLTALEYLLKEIATPDNLRLIVFLYGFGALVGLVRVTGGVSGFSRWMEQRVKTVRGAMALTWLSSAATFMAPDFRIITIAPVMKHVFDRLKLPAFQSALAIDITATPLTAVIPFGTAFVGYMVGLVAASVRHHAGGMSPFQIFLASLPWNLFAWGMLIFGFWMSFFPRTRFNRESRPEAAPKAAARPLSTVQRLRFSEQVARMEAAHELTFGSPPHPPTPSSSAKAGSDDPPDPVEFVAELTPPRAVNLVLPILLLLGLTFFLTWWNGRNLATTVFGSLAKADAARAMLEALLITIVLSLIWYAIQRQPIQRTMFGFLAGGNEMMGVIVLLVFVWAVSAVSADLGFVTYTRQIIGTLVPPILIAPALFVFGCLISYAIGSSFGTWGILLPLGFSLALASHASIPLVVGAVFASGTFGGFASPLSDNTVAMATVMKFPVMDYARRKLWPAVSVAGVCTVIYGIAGFWLQGRGS